MLLSDKDRKALIHGSQSSYMYTLNLKRPVVCSIASSVLLRGSLAVALSEARSPISTNVTVHRPLLYTVFPTYFLKTSH